MSNLNKNNTKKLWEIVNKSIGKLSNKKCVIESLKSENLIHTKPKDIADELCKHYSQIGAKLSKKIPKLTIDKLNYINKIPQNSESLFLIPTSENEIIRIIEKLPNKKSSGFDNVNNIILKKIKHKIASPLHTVFNLSMQKDQFPDLMKKAKVVPLHKGKERDLSTNYRPISLLLTISKVLEKIIYKRTYKFLDKKGQLFNSQYGFRSKHSCENAITELISQVVKGHE